MKVSRKSLNFQEIRLPLDINVRTIGEEYNANVLERELLAVTG